MTDKEFSDEQLKCLTIIELEALLNNTSISPSYRERIKSIIDEMNNKPNHRKTPRTPTNNDDFER